MPQPPRRAKPTPNIRTPRIRGLAAALAAAVLALSAGCQDAQTTGAAKGDKALAQYKDEGSRLFSDTPPPPPPDSDSPFAEPAPQRNPDAWIIVLTTVPGDARVIGEQMLGTARKEGGVPQAYLVERAGKLFVATGSFTDPSSADARAELARVQAVHVRGGRPYTFAFLAPPESGGGANPAYDLRRAKELFGSKALYTLQIGIYGHADGRTPTPEELKLFRDTAEKAVAQLRAEGELAFYYHDRTRSSVTVGIFGEDDHDASVRPPFESVRLEQTRERHPNNLLNGQGIKEIVRGTDGLRRETIQKSFLVAVPK